MLEIAFKNSRLERWARLPLCFIGSFCRCGTHHHPAIGVAIHSHHCCGAVQSNSLWLSGERALKCGGSGFSGELSEERRQKEVKRTRAQKSTRHGNVQPGMGRCRENGLHSSWSRNVVLLALDPKNSHTPKYILFAYNICDLHTPFIQLKKTIPCNKNNNNIDNNPTHTGHIRTKATVSTLHVLTHWFLTTTLWAGYHNCPIIMM